MTYSKNIPLAEDYAIELEKSIHAFYLKRKWIKLFFSLSELSAEIVEF
jgi:hypothetical protein